MKTFIPLLIFFFLSVNCYSQNYIFKMYSYECSEIFDVKLKKPKGFNVIAGNTPFKINDKKPVGMFYRLSLETKDKNCLLLFPYFLYREGLESSTKIMTYAELEAALNVEEYKLDSDTIKKYVQLICNKNMNNYFNADTVYISKLPLSKPYEEIYTHCIGINAFKKDRSVMIKVFLTDKGKEKEEKYLNQVLSSIHYRNENWEFNPLKVKETRKKLKSRFLKHWDTYSRFAYDISDFDLRKFLKDNNTNQ